MMAARAKPDDIVAQIRDLLAQSTIADDVRSVRIEEVRDDDGVDFLRVFVRVRDPEILNWVKLKPLVQQIEDSLAALDERFPSIRLAA